MKRELSNGLNEQVSMISGLIAGPGRPHYKTLRAITPLSKIFLFFWGSIKV